MNFTVLVPAHMKELEFTWQAHQKSILYSWSAAYSSLAMTPPMFNISMQGEIPPRLETFRVTFPCTGTVSDDIKVVLQLNISLPHRHGVTSLNFQRNKICLKEEKRASLLCNLVGSVFGILKIFPYCLLLILTSLRSSPLFDSSTSYTSAAYATNPNVFIRLDAMDAGSYDTIASFKKVPMASSVKSVPSPYATTCVTSYKGKTSHHVYATPITYYASSNVSSQVSHLSSRLKRLMDEHMHIKLADNALSRDIFPCDYHCLDDNENRPVKWMALESILEYESDFRMDEHMHIKLADNALSRDIFPCDYHCLDDNENRPVKWMALESILEYEYSGASDVVSLSSV
ncbi:tyrosine-protein kinase RYK-like [Diaphorina citri]|uniref:Tyrosine-protein kinase RYK-like n=1 Tax=Diaphorina citri TaxID=121845 RepID=A0A3Q0J2R6_DIACI|nr:tyrosine-protein kinase RYK-like [Diaphorina citri]